MPSVLTDLLPALEAATNIEMVRITLKALHAVRKSFMEAESNKKIQRVLRSNVRTYAVEGFVTGDTVYYRRQNCKGWHSPVKVLSKDGQCVLIRHWGAFYRIHPCNSMKANKKVVSPRNEGNKELGSPRNEKIKLPKLK